MLLSTSNALLLTALTFNVVSTFGAPIPLARHTTVAFARAGDKNGPKTHSRHLEKRYRSWNKASRAVREDTLNALKRAESRAAAIAEARESIRRVFELEDRDFEDFEEEIRGLTPSHEINRRDSHTADLDDLMTRDFVEELEERHARRSKGKKGKGKGKNQRQTTIVSLDGLDLLGGFGTCSCSSAPPPIQNNCPAPGGGQPVSTPGSTTTGGSGGSGVVGNSGDGSGGSGSGGSVNSTMPLATDPTSNPVDTGSTGSGTNGTTTPDDSTAPSATDPTSSPVDTGSTGSGTNGTTTPDDSTAPSATDPASSPIDTGSTGSGTNGTTTPDDSTAPLATDPASSPSDSVTGSANNGTTAPDGGDVGGGLAGTSGNSTASPTGDGSDGANSTSTSDPSDATDSGTSTTGAPTERRLFQRWLSAQPVVPVKRVKSARFRNV
ncbi:hypothetical protein B0H15DRAFT_950768 [Mycena belliarum]|uniref:Uncharacterized protein n=1 Tax=Mycena belliarum TaxID=1033014 RepID=A0AAD6U1E2_9AGAR|nr:hypothetical protein B0H15DRAFT_950768 [Mycena belliae]